MDIKNIKVYNLKKNKKYVLKKTIATALVTLTLLTTLTGCFGDKTSNKHYDGFNYNNSNYGYNIDYSKYNYDEYNSFYDNDNTNNNNNNSTNYETNTNPAPMIVYDESTKKIINSYIRINGDVGNDFINQVNYIKVDYPLSDLYKVDDVLNKYFSINSYKINVSQNIINNNNISADTLYEIVSKNNTLANFEEQKSLSSSELRKLCTIISGVINDYLKNNDVDKNLLVEKILNLKIKKYFEMSNGYFDPLTGVMGFDINKINSSEDFYKKTVEHETYHFLQASSLNENNSSDYINRMGICYKFDNVKVNSLYWDWFYEGTAEYLTLNRNNTKETNVYKNIIDSIDIIKTATILKPNINVNDLETLSLSNDLNAFFEYFGCKNYEQQKELVSMMYGYNILHTPNSFATSTDFYNLYKEINGESLSGEDSFIFERKLKNSISQSLSKYFYINLTNSIKDNEVKVDDVFSIINLFEHMINRQNRYNVSEYYKEDYENFFDNYLNIQNEFFQILADKLEVSVDDVYNAYNAYNKYGQININNNLILNSEQKEFYNFILSTKTNSIDSINYKYQRFFEKQQTR